VANQQGLVEDREARYKKVNVYKGGREHQFTGFRAPRSLQAGQCEYSPEAANEADNEISG
jgi:hypothetical protein